METLGVERETGRSRSLVRGLAILSSFSSTRHLAGISELARELGLTRSTAHRYVSTLSDLGYLQQDPVSRKYRLGPRVLDLGFSAIHAMDVREIAAPHLQRLSDETGFTANLAILDGADVVYIERCRTSRPGQREIDLDLHVGSRLPAYCTALGKALLAFLPDDERDAIVRSAKLEQRGPNTIVERRALLAELDRVREAGIAVNNEELAYGLRSIAAPVRTKAGAARAAINLAVHRSMVSMDDLIARFGPVVRRTAEDISAQMSRSGQAE